MGCDFTRRHHLAQSHFRLMLPANVVVWPSLFEKRRRVVLGSFHDGDQRPHPNGFFTLG
ncbi:hypothetical protein [Rhizobium leguminosarum]|jgi:hypothetical protein|uniref:hypothetical protein n=1 Tax=Rhizobium leguminosarum TaxID=384 RepID=UPI0013F3EA8E|nr:hypothetical protein [Rhizobium leguminosarum]